MKHNTVFLLIILFITLLSCGKDKLKFHHSSKNGVDEIDTIGHHPERNIYVLGFVRNGALGHFAYDLAIEKSDGNGQRQPILYEMKKRKRRFRVTNEHILLLGEKKTDTVGKWSKDDILNAIDSVFKLKQLPKELNFNATN